MDIYFLKKHLLGDRVYVEDRFKLPIKHLKPRELVRAYLAVQQHILKGKCVFNYRLEPPLRPRRPGESEWEYRWWQFLRSKEIDAVCFEGSTAYIVEFKDRARPSGVGQLLTYAKLFREQEKWGGEIKLMYIVGEGDPQVEKVCKDLGIEVVVLNVPAYQRRYFRPEEFGLKR